VLGHKADSLLHARSGVMVGAFWVPCGVEKCIGFMGDVPVRAAVKQIPKMKLNKLS